MIKPGASLEWVPSLADVLARCWRAKSNIRQHFSLVGTAERFEDTLRVAAGVLGWSTQPETVRLLVNEGRQPSSSITSITREAILERNALDLELYSFANEWLNDRLRTADATTRRKPLRGEPTPQEQSVVGVTGAVRRKRPLHKARSYTG